METTTQPLSKKEAAELRSYVEVGPALFRASAFLGVVCICGWLLKTIHSRLARDFSLLSHDALWITPLLLFTVGLYLASSRWTGGPSFRAKVRADLSRGVASVRRISACDAIEVDEREDEGHGYLIRTEDGKTVLFAGQYLETYIRKGFPWKSFDIIEAPESRVFFDIVAAGDRLEPSSRRPPLTWEEAKRFGILTEKYVSLDLDFDALRTGTTSE
jgi:hypothetical protein